MTKPGDPMILAEKPATRKYGDEAKNSRPNRLRSPVDSANDKPRDDHDDANGYRHVETQHEKDDS